MKRKTALTICMLALLLPSCGASSSSSSYTEQDFANGVFDFSDASVEEKTKITGELEKYAIKNHLNGLTLYGDGYYQLFDTSVKKGTESYIPDYGFGVLEEGELIADLPGEESPSLKRYYHTYVPAAVKSYSPLVTQWGSIYSYAFGSYFAKRPNAEKTGFEFYGDLSTQNRPLLLNPDPYGRGTRFRVEVKVGSALKYATLSDKFASFKGREAQLEDYLVPFKIMLTKAYRVGYSSIIGVIEGAGDFWKATEDGYHPELWDKVGIKTVEEGGKSYVDFTFKSKNSVSDVMGLFTLPGVLSPIPASFIEAIGGGDFASGVACLGKKSETGSAVDHVLSTGPYVLERLEEGSDILFKKNPFHVEEGRYRIEGISLKCMPEQQTDNDAPLKAFLKGKLHEVDLFSHQIEDHLDDPRLATIPSHSTYKLNLNTCQDDFWESLFGEKGSVTQTKKEDYWVCEPAMADDDFIEGLSFALDRALLAKQLRRSPCADFLGDQYRVDPLSGIAYNRSQVHLDAVASLREGTDGYGYSLEKARECFLKSARRLIKKGAYRQGDTIEIEIAWQTKDQIQQQGDFIASNFEKAFNFAENPLKLKVVNWVGKAWSDVFYKKMMVGQFDIGFGAISGGAGPLDYFEFLRSDNSSMFTLNWGANTNAVDLDSPLVFRGKKWSFDALQNASMRPTFVEDGANTPMFSFSDELRLSRDEQGNLLVEGQCRQVAILREGAEEPLSDQDYDLRMRLVALTLYGQSGDEYHESEKINLGEGLEIEPIVGSPYNTKFTATIPSSVADDFNADTFRLGVDLYVDAIVLGEEKKNAYWGSIILVPGSLPS